MSIASPIHSPDRPLQSDAHPAAVALSTLGPGSQARIIAVAAASDDAARLMALGVCTGRRVEVVKAGDPLIVSVVGARVGLSARLAAGVTVQTNNSSASPARTAARLEAAT